MFKGYSEDFYQEMKDSNFISAKKILPIVFDYIKPLSVIDIGCGTGLWLKAFNQLGVKNILGCDGDWVKNEMLVIDKNNFKRIDIGQKIEVGKFDLAICLEVAEHLPKEQSDQLVNNLISASDIVLFSAAIPLQGGSRHINEQWPTYWSELFAKFGYIPVDCLRRKIWQDSDISFFYRQNILFYVDSKKIDQFPKLKQEIDNGYGVALPLVHPDMYLYYAERWRLIVPWLGKIPPGLLHKIKKVLKFLKRSS